MKTLTPLKTKNKYRDLRPESGNLPLAFYKYVIPLSKKVEKDAAICDRLWSSAYRKFQDPKRAEDYFNRQYTKWRCGEDLIYLAKKLGYKEWGHIHYVLADWLKVTKRYDNSGTRGIFIFRGAGKSTMANRIETIQSFINNPNNIILQMGGQWTNAAESVYKPMLENVCGNFLQSYFPEIFGSSNIKHLNLQKWRSTQNFNVNGFDTIHNRVEVGSSCSFATIDQLPTGCHPFEVKLDDCVIPENTKTEKAIKTTKDTIRILDGVLMPPYTRMVIGTIYKSTDYYWTELLPDLIGQDWYKVKNVIYPFVNDSVFWLPAEWYDPEKGEYVLAYPERFTKEFLNKKKISMKDDYRTQYLMQPDDSIGSYFPLNYSSPEKCKYQQSQIYNPDGSMKRLNIVLYIDPAGSGNKAPTTSDFSAIVMAGMDSDENVYTLDYWHLQNQSYGQIAEAVWDMCSKRAPQRVLFEKNIQNELYNALVRERENIAKQYPAHLLNIPIVSVSHTGYSAASKANRIKGALQDFWLKGKLKFLDDHSDILEQLLPYGGPNTVEHDDLIDALAGAVADLSPPPAQNPYIYDFGVIDRNEEDYFYGNESIMRKVA